MSTPDRWHVGLVAPAQHASLVALLCELHAYYNDGAAVAPALVRGHLIDHLLAADSPLRLVVATGSEGEVFGFAAIALMYSLVEPAPDKRRQCLLKELYVVDAARGLGVGRALMRWVARHAVEQGCGRIDWPVNAANQRGIAFYEALGARRVADRLSYRLAGPGLGRLAAETGP